MRNMNDKQSLVINIEARGSTWKKYILTLNTNSTQLAHAVIPCDYVLATLDKTNTLMNTVKEGVFRFPPLW